MIMIYGFLLDLDNDHSRFRWNLGQISKVVVMSLKRGEWEERQKQRVGKSRKLWDISHEPRVLWAVQHDNIDDNRHEVWGGEGEVAGEVRESNTQ